MRRVFFDPDGTHAPYLGVLLEYATGVIYAHQCGGVANLERSVEGYFVPLGGLTFDTQHSIDPLRLRSPFHDGESCRFGGESRSEHPNYSDLSGKRLESLIELVAEIPWWSLGGFDGSERSKLKLDEKRLAEIVEAWVPVDTPDGPGILIWPNCD